MSIRTYDSRFFRILDTILFFIGEFLLGFILLFPLFYVWFKVSSTPGEAGRGSALGQFVTFRNGTALITIAGLALIHSIIVMSINATALIYLSLLAFIFVIYLGFGLAGMLGLAAAALAVFAVGRNVRLNNFFVDGFNMLIKRWKKAGMKKMPGQDSIFPVGGERWEKAEGGQTFAALAILAIALFFIVTPVALALFIIFHPLK